MPLSWHSPELVTSGLAPRDSGAAVMTALGSTSASMRSLVELRLRALDAALAAGEPRILADHLQWERVRLRTIAPLTSSADVGRALHAVLSAALHRDALNRVEALDRRATELADGPGLTPADGPLVDRAGVGAYLERIVAGDREGALAVVMAAADRAEHVTDVLLNLLQPAQRELGRRWEEGTATVGQEHFGTAVTQQAIAMLYPRIFTGRSSGRRLVAVAAGTDAHEVGLRIVTDVLESEGWKTVYLGSSVPPEDVLDQLISLDADVLALSVSMAAQLGPVRRLVEAVRAEPRCDRVRVLVGGRLLIVAPQLADWLGADGSAADARDVVAVCEQMVAGARAGA